MRPKARADAAGSSERQSFSRLGVASRRCIRRSDRHHLSPPCQRCDGEGRLNRPNVRNAFRLVNGWAAGGGHSLHSTCDLTPASREHALFNQTDADVGSFDGSYGSAYLARQVGQKFAREIFFLGRAYTGEQMQRMGAVNEAVDHAALESVGLQWAAEINAKPPQAQRMLKYAFNLLDDGLVGQQLFAGEASRLAYMTDEAVEGRDAFLEKRDPDYGRFGRYF
jgi:naphthoate synthase